MSKENVFVIDDPSLIGWVEDGVTLDGDPIWKWDQEGASDSTGAGMIICSEAELPPVNERVTGMQWLDSESSNVYVWDDDKWLMFPATGGQGADGAPGEVEEAPDDGKQYIRESKDWSELVLPEGGTGSSVHIGEAPPADPQEGQQWMEVPADGDATMWIYDGGKWLQSPAGKDGKDGKDGADGGIPDAPSDTKQYARQDGGWSEVSSGLWTDEGSNTISYSGTVLMSQLGAGKDAVAVGREAGEDTQGEGGVAIGWGAGYGTQGKRAIAVGTSAGLTNQGDYTVSVGPNAGSTSQGQYGISIGYNAGTDTQGSGAVAIGGVAGNVTQGSSAVAVGASAGETNQGDDGIAIGRAAGFLNQSDKAVAIGYNCGVTSQGYQAVAAGYLAGYENQSANAVALGYKAGYLGQAASSIAIGEKAGENNQGANGIIISSAGIPIDNTNADHIQLQSSPTKYLLYNGTNSWTFSGGAVNGLNGFRQNGAPVIDAKGLINTLSTLRNATKDETTLEGIRDALSDAIGGLIQNLEHEIATQEIES